MSAEQWPTEDAATKAVDAAAKNFFERAVKAQGGDPDGVDAWENQEPTIKNVWRQQVLPIVWAALQALPDPRSTAWLQGLYAGLRGGYEDDNPYEEV